MWRIGFSALEPIAERSILKRRLKYTNQKTVVHSSRLHVSWEKRKRNHFYLQEKPSHREIGRRFRNQYSISNFPTYREWGQNRWDSDLSTSQKFIGVDLALIENTWKGWNVWCRIVAIVRFWRKFRLQNRYRILWRFWPTSSRRDLPLAWLPNNRNGDGPSSCKESW